MTAPADEDCASPQAAVGRAQMDRMPTADTADERDRAREERALDELTKVFHDREMAEQLVERAGFPVSRVPAFTVSHTFWNHVVREARKGLLSGGIQPILERAAELYPRNPVFAPYRRVSSGTADSREVTPRRLPPSTLAWALLGLFLLLVASVSFTPWILQENIVEPALGTTGGTATNQGLEDSTGMASSGGLDWVPELEPERKAEREAEPERKAEPAPEPPVRSPRRNEKAAVGIMESARETLSEPALESEPKQVSWRVVRINSVNEGDRKRIELQGPSLPPSGRLRLHRAVTSERRFVSSVQCRIERGIPPWCMLIEKPGNDGLVVGDVLQLIEGS